MTTGTQRAGVARLSTWTGLGLALLAPILSYACMRCFYGPQQTVARTGLGLALHWLNLAAVILVVLVWERRPLGSIGLRPVRWPTIPLGVLFGLAVFLSAPLIARLNVALGLSGNGSLAAFLMTLPFWMRVLVVVTAGVFEETLFRGYALERLAELTGSKWLAASVTVAAFALTHIPAVGFAHLLPVFVVSVLVTLLYLWKRDLLMNIVAHIVIDGVALLILPALVPPGAR